MNCCSVKSRRTPVSGSGVRLAEKLTPQGPETAVMVDAVAAIHGSDKATGALMMKSCGWPDSARVMSGSGPFGPILNGVWQSWQPDVETMYSPRLTCASGVLPWPRTAAGADKAVAKILSKMPFIGN